MEIQFFTEIIFLIWYSSLFNLFFFSRSQSTKLWFDVFCFKRYGSIGTCATRWKLNLFFSTGCVVVVVFLSPPVRFSGVCSQFGLRSAWLATTLLSDCFLLFFCSLWLSIYFARCTRNFMSVWASSKFGIIFIKAPLLRLPPFVFPSFVYFCFCFRAATSLRSHSLEF